MTEAPPMMERPAPRAWNKWLWLGAGLAGLAILLVLHFFPPGQYPIYPVCALKQSTGLDCPGCGGLRAMHQLTNGNLAAAWRLNPAVFILLPLFAYEILIREAFKRPHLSVLARPRVLILFGLFLLAFSLVRNLPLFARWFS